MRQYIEYVTGPIPDEDWKLFDGLSYPVARQKGDILLDFGRTCKDLWFLKSGAIRKMEHINGSTKTSHFYVAPFLFTVYKSVLRQEPSEMAVICESDCELDVIPYANLARLYDRSHAIERVGRIMAEHQYIEEFELRKMLLTKDAMERLEYLEAQQPELFQHFQLKDIATFLGMTPVSLSRLRKQRWSKTHQ